MRMDFIGTCGSTECGVTAPRPYEDPLERDLASDEIVHTTRRALVRLALVAAESASRFARDGVDGDPVAWMLAPRRLFDGRTPLEACLDRDDCLRAVLLHGLALGTDADPGALDDLMAEDEDDMDENDEVLAPHDDRGAPDVGQGDCGSGSAGARPRLWTSYVVSGSETSSLHAFDAIVAVDRSEAETRIRRRHGRLAPADVEIVEGFDACRPLVEALVSPALTDMLEQVARDPSSVLAKGLSISIQQRFVQ
ncbi:hypothetical protein [Sphingomonas panni]|uniref:hypothetical protein n=1 Tax=Sphingomonas panni TaxID=237612 RepID=UPI001F5B929C|nr:hypothetical protein [Sphingomonas panni]